nr:hypothetical protein [Gemmatimonadales bacterium]
PVSVTFTLPATLAHPTLPLSAWTGLVNTTPSSNSAVAFAPSAVPRTLSAGSGRLYLWVGATLTALSTPSGNYTAPVTITVVYN